MPHFIIHCSNSISKTHPLHKINEQVSQVAEQSGLFDVNDIKVRCQGYDQYLVGNSNTPFIHVFAHIMQGRTESQRASLSNAVVTQLACMFPQVTNIAMNISEFEKSTYCNLAILA